MASGWLASTFPPATDEGAPPPRSGPAVSRSGAGQRPGCQSRSGPVTGPAAVGLLLPDVDRAGAEGVSPLTNVDEEVEAAFDKFFSAEVEPEPAQRWLLND